MSARFAGVITALVIVAACGGSGTSSPTSPSGSTSGSGAGSAAVKQYIASVEDMTVLEDGLLGGPVTAQSGAVPAASSGPAVRVLNALSIPPDQPTVTGIGTVDIVSDSQYTTLYVWATGTDGYYKMTWKTPRSKAQVYVSGPSPTLSAQTYEVAYAVQSPSGVMGPYTRYTVRR